MSITRNTKRNAKKSKPKYTKTDLFVDAINIMAQCIEEFDATLIIDRFNDDRIRSSDFTLDGFIQTRKEFVKEYKQKIGCPAAKLIKLYLALITKYRITGFCQRVSSIPNLFNSGSLVFISPKYTEQIICEELICLSESNTLNDSRRLYQYLNWTIRVNKINKYVNCFSTMNKKENNIPFLLINSELHNHDGDVLYMFCIQNDIKSEKAQKWQFVKLVTGTELIELVPDRALTEIISQFVDDQDSVCSVLDDRINEISCIISQYMGQYCDNTILPLGARANGAQFDKLRQNKMITKKHIWGRMEVTSYLQLKGIQTGHDKNRKGNRKSKKEVLRISLDEFERCIEAAAKSDNERHDLIPIVSILSGKKYGDGDYSVDQVLPVYIRGNWVGICYRDGKPVMELFDGYDITNKAILCQPTFDKNRLEFFTNNIYKIEILPRDQVQPEIESVYNETPELCANSPTSDHEIMGFDTTPLSSVEQEDAYMGFEPQPDHPDLSSSSPASISQTQIYVDAEDKQEMKYNYINEALCHNNNDVPITAMSMNMNLNMTSSPSSTNGTGNGEGIINSTPNTNTNMITAIQATPVTPVSMDGMNTSTNTNTCTPMGFNTTTTMNLNHVQSMNPINGQYQFKSNNQPQQVLQPLQQLCNQQIYINNFNYPMLNLSTMPIIPNFQLQNTLNLMNISTPKPSEGFQPQTLPSLNLPPMTPQNTTFVPIYCYVPAIPLQTMSTPMMQQQPIIGNQQLQQFKMHQHINSTPMVQEVMTSTNSMGDASTPEFIPITKQNRSSSIPKPASIVPTVSTIKEEI